MERDRREWDGVQRVSKVTESLEVVPSSNDMLNENRLGEEQLTFKAIISTCCN